MFLSMLLINVGDNPDHPRPGRTWLRNLYRVHQRLCMAFPTKQQKDNDDPFLQPFVPEQFAQGHVHVQRDDKCGFLFRVDPQPAGRCVIFILSALKPDWEYAFQNARHLLAGPPQTRPFSPQIVAGQQWRFRTTCNAVFRARKTSKHPGGAPIYDDWIGKRIGISGDEKSLRNWIDRRADAAGFAVRTLTLAQPGYVYINKGGRDTKGQCLRSIRYEGVLEITNPDAFLRTLFSGIGPAKAFGFGLLSIAPLAQQS